MPKEFRKIEKFCVECGQRLELNNTRDVNRKRFCNRKCNGKFSGRTLREEFKQQAKIWLNTPSANMKKGLPGKLNPRWIEDRTKLKNKRYYYEEKQFIQSIMKERNYTCELTGCHGSLSVHHKNSVKDFPHLRFDKSNVIVIKRDIHKKFHNMYGTLNVTEDKWNRFVENKEYAILQPKTS